MDDVDNCRTTANADQADTDGDRLGDACEDADLDGSPDIADCGPTDPTIHPGGVEFCNSVDDNCDGATDEGIPVAVYYRDADGDGYGDVASFANGCAAPAGYVVDATDCNDTNAMVNPARAEVCDGLDNNCNGRVDDGLALNTFYWDSDLDGHGSNRVTATRSCWPTLIGYARVNDDCDDVRATVYPGHCELVDKRDNDCDGKVDERSDRCP